MKKSMLVQKIDQKIVQYPIVDGVVHISVFQLYLVNFKWLKFIPPTANSCYLGQNISWGQKIFQKF